MTPANDRQSSLVERSDLRRALVKFGGEAFGFRFDAAPAATLRPQDKRKSLAMVGDNRWYRVRVHTAYVAPQAVCMLYPQ